MTINRNNCEAVFLDYYEKNLSPVEVAEVLFFLEENPDLKEVFESYEAICLEHEKINFPDKEAIKKKYSSEEISAILSSDITRANCEQFFIANTEEILSSSQKERLHLFLLQYPELKKEHDLFLQCKLPEAKIAFEGKEALKKETITKENREEYFVRAIENDLNPSEQKALNIFLAKNPELKKEFELFSKAILPFETISFENKSSLKKRERRPVFVSIFSNRTTNYAAAAAILLLVGLFFVFKNDDTQNPMLADKNKPAEKIENTVAPEKKEKSQTRIHNLQDSRKQQDAGSRNQSSGVVIKKNTSAPLPEAKQEENQPQPIIFEDDQNLVADKEIEKPKMMEQEFIVEKKQEEKKENEEVQSEVFASVKARPKEEYQTLGAFARKKIKSLLGIQNTNPCEEQDKLTVWDLAMAAKKVVQKKTGTNVDVNKVCNGTGEAEYIFTAGNFEISRSASK